MFKETIQTISNDFIAEAKLSPNLLEDMASMEKYMAESYSSRTFIELLQNADDALATKITVLEDNDNIYVANNGKPFDDKDLISICRSGSSSKERGQQIGYRGVGFKSTTQISNEILVFSNGACFSFSKSLCSQLLNKEESTIPTVRIPIVVENVGDNIQKQADKLTKSGYKTIFVFKHPRKQIFLEDVKGICSGYFLFLNHIRECQIKIECITALFSVERIVKSSTTQVKILGEHTSEEWLIFQKNNVACGFKLKDGKIVACSKDEAVYHSYLPTIDKFVYPFKVNADFSTDPSRKHITYDESTKSAIGSVSILIFDAVKSFFDNNSNAIYTNVLELFTQTLSFSKVNVDLEKRLKELFTQEKWLVLGGGDVIKGEDYKLLDKNLMKTDTISIRKQSPFIKEQSLSLKIYENLSFVDEFMQKYSEASYSYTEIVTALEDTNFSNKIPTETFGRLFTVVVKELKFQNTFGNSKVTIDNIVVPTNDESFSTLKELEANDYTISTALSESFKENLISSDITWLLKETGLSKKSLQIETEPMKTLCTGREESVTKVHKPFLTKWRNAEQKCIEIEQFFGNKATDVSRRNEGYDILSITPDNKKRYIEVKSVKKDWEFSLTNNEYTAASLYLDDYFICLLCENSENLEVRYIQSPLSNASFEKRIKQWEWVCNEFSFSEFKFDIE